jgi:hypothetical protein
MTRDMITARNRANATKSTGPRSNAGKVAVAQNARRHGATSQPDPESVAVWASIILDQPDLGGQDLGLSDLLAGDARTRSAMALAVSEVRLAQAQRALEEFEAGTASAQPDFGDEQVAEAQSILSEALRLSMDSGEAMVLLNRLLCVPDDGQAMLNARQDRLLRRYWREARAQRRRAFRAWMAVCEEMGPSPL